MSSKKEKFNKLLKDTNRTVRLIGEYGKKTAFQCLLCGRIYDAYITNVKRGHDCQKCSHKSAAALKFYSVDAINLKLKERNINGNVIERCGDHILVDLFCKHSPLKLRMGDVINGRKGCKQCYHENRKLTPTIVNDRLEKMGSDVRLIGEYIRIDVQSLFKCLICGNEYKTTPHSPLHGKECPLCNPGGFDKSKAGSLYYIKIYSDKIYYKIGITNKRKITDRFLYDNVTYEVILTKRFKSGYTAFEKEQSILKEFNEYRYKGSPILKSGGNSEILVVDIMNFNLFNDIWNQK